MRASPFGVAARRWLSGFLFVVKYGEMLSFLAKLGVNLLMGMSAGLQMDFSTASAVEETLCFQKQPICICYFSDSPREAWGELGEGLEMCFTCQDFGFAFLFRLSVILKLYL